LPEGIKMNFMDELQFKLPVLLLHNMNPAWTEEEQSESEQDVVTLGNALNESGIRHSINSAYFFNTISYAIGLTYTYPRRLSKYFGVEFRRLPLFETSGI
jgi:hypothetical protein